MIMKRNILGAIAAIFFCGISHAQTIDERIAEAMNSESWYELKEIYDAHGQEIQTPFLKPLSEYFIAHFFNRPDTALHYGNILLEKYQAELGGSVGKVMYFMADDAARSGDPEYARQILHAYNEACRQAGLSDMSFDGIEQQYQALAQRGGFKVERSKKDVIIPLVYHSGNRKDPVSVCVNAEINGKKARFHYDTGAGVNVISHELADELGITPIDSASIKVKGVTTMTSRFAIADSIKLGDIVYRNVPFQIIDFSTGNAEADVKMRETGLQCVLGSQTMMPLGEIWFDFASSCLVVPAEPSLKPDYAPNMYRDAANAFVVNVYDYASDSNIEAVLDTGASYGGHTFKYYDKNRSLFEGVVPTDTIRYAGAGGVGYSKVCYKDMKYNIGGQTLCSDSATVSMEGSIQGEAHDMLLGLPEMTKFNKMIINFTDMWVKFE